MFTLDKPIERWNSLEIRELITIFSKKCSLHYNAWDLHDAPPVSESLLH